MNSSKYILLINSSSEVLTLQEAALRSFYMEDIFSFKNSLESLNFIEKRGTPELIVMDYQNLIDQEAHFYRFLDAEGIHSPFFVLTKEKISEETKSFYPLITAFIESPSSNHEFTSLMKGILQGPFKFKSHLPIRISVLLRIGTGGFDLFLKLSEKNFVKIIHRGESFFESDAKKLSDKGINELYIGHEDGQKFLKLLENSIKEESIDSIEATSKTIENLETFEEIARAMGWPPAILSLAQKSVTRAVKILSKNTSILSILKRQTLDPNSMYSRHVGLLSYLVCAFSSSLGWIGEAGQIKLAMAAMLHDAAIDESLYEDLHRWNKQAVNSSDLSSDCIRYRMHPYEASKIVRSMESFSPDVDQIVLQHHEVMDGGGFPVGMDPKRIGHLPALFIIVEDLVHFIGDGQNIETSIVDFITCGRAKYNTGNFEKIFMAFEEKLRS